MNPQPLATSQPSITAPSATPPSFGKRVFAALGNPYVPPIFITLILLVGNLSYGILESYSKTLLAIVTERHRRDGPRTNLSAQMAPSSQRLYHRYQRQDSIALPRILAVRTLQPALHYIKIRTSLSWPPYLEPLQLRHLRNALSRLSIRGFAQHSVGQ